MSLLWRRRSIARAAAGLLSPAAEASLRAHLRRCTTCRRHYDALVLVAGAADDAGEGRVAARRAQVRLAQALGVAATGRTRWRWLVPATVLPLAGAAAALLLYLRAPADQVTLRGDDDSAAAEARREAARAALSLRFYARRKAPPAGATPPPVRLLGTLPASGELRASHADELQIGYSGLREPRHLLLLGLDERGIIHRYHPAPGAAGAPLHPTGEARLLGETIDLRATHPSGRVLLWAVVGKTPPEPGPAEAALRDRARGVTAETHFSGPGFGGTLWIEP